MHYHTLRFFLPHASTTSLGQNSCSSNYDFFLPSWKLIPALYTPTQNRARKQTCQISFYNILLHLCSINQMCVICGCLNFIQFCDPSHLPQGDTHGLKGHFSSLVYPSTLGCTNPRFLVQPARGSSQELGLEVGTPQWTSFLWNSQKLYYLQAQRVSLLVILFPPQYCSECKFVTLHIILNFHWGCC